MDWGPYGRYDLDAHYALARCGHPALLCLALLCLALPLSSSPVFALHCLALLLFADVHGRKSFGGWFPVLEPQSMPSKPTRVAIQGSLGVVETQQFVFLTQERAGQSHGHRGQAKADARLQVHRRPVFSECASLPIFRLRPKVCFAVCQPEATHRCPF